MYVFFIYLLYVKTLTKRNDRILIYFFWVSLPSRWQKTVEIEIIAKGLSANDTANDNYLSITFLQHSVS